MHRGHRARVPRVVNEPRAVRLALTRQQLAFSANVPSYRHPWALAGDDPHVGESERLLVDVLVYGSEADGVAGLRSWRTDGLGDILAYPLLDPAERKGSLPRALAAMARAARQGP